MPLAPPRRWGAAVATLAVRPTSSSPRLASLPNQIKALERSCFLTIGDASRPHLKEAWSSLVSHRLWRRREYSGVNLPLKPISAMQTAKFRETVLQKRWFRSESLRVLLCSKCKESRGKVGLVAQMSIKIKTIHLFKSFSIYQTLLTKMDFSH